MSELHRNTDQDAFPGEEWRDVPDYPGYQASNLGRVRSSRRGNWRILLQREGNKYGHLTCCIYKNSVGGPALVHRLVLRAFVGPGEDGQECCHNDGNPKNNHLDNLRWDTKVGNMRDRSEHGNDWQARKDRCPQGHPYTPENTYISPNDPSQGRRCRQCNRDRANAHYARKCRRLAGMEP